MSWKPIDFQGIVSLNPTIIDQLNHFLDEKESHLSYSLSTLIPTYEVSGVPEILPPAHGATMRLSEGVEAFSKTTRQLLQKRQAVVEPERWNEAAEKANGLFWEYLETLEECVTELFQQLDQVGIVDWRPDLRFVVKSIKEALIHRMDDLKWALIRVEANLKEYRAFSEKKSGGWSHILDRLCFWRSILDKSLWTNLDKCQKYLGFRYQGFNDRFSRYNDINKRIQHALEKFNWYDIFKTLEHDSQEKFKQIYQNVKLWELNAKAKALPQRQVVLTLRNLINPEKALQIFREYYNALRRVLYDKGRGIKVAANPPDNEDLYRIQEEILVYRGELHTLASTITKYRDFLLKTDPNPYVRSRWGFPEWVVGPESSQTTHMLGLSYEVETLDGIFESFRQAMERKTNVEDTPVSDLDNDVKTVLHEMSQPLMSKDMMRLRAERLLEQLEKVEELTTTDKNAIEFVGNALSKAMRADWKYHVLFDLPAFHKIYTIHHGLLGPIDDRNHINRISRFKRLIQQIEGWIRSNDTPRHSQEIEHDMSDMKVYLQDFLAHVQRLVKEEPQDRETRERRSFEISNQLLEYRYLFGHFFKQLRDNKPEERMIRNQFLFVDQYFEAVENLLNEWKINAFDS